MRKENKIALKPEDFGMASEDVNVRISTDDRLAYQLDRLILALINPRPAVKARIILGGSMSTGAPTTPQITVDTQGEYAEVQFVDDHGNVTSAPPGTTVTFASSDQNIVTVASDATNPLRANISPVGNPGNVDVSVTVSGANDPSGNPIPNPDPVTLTVNPGAAVGERLSVAQNQQPTPTPTTPAPTTPDNPPAPTTPDNPPAPATTAAQPTQPVYTTDLDPTTVDSAEWPASGFQTDEATPRPLYYFNGDDANSGQNGTANGQSANWNQWTGGVNQMGV